MFINAITIILAIVNSERIADIDIILKYVLKIFAWIKNAGLDIPKLANMDNIANFMIIEIIVSSVIK